MRRGTWWILSPAAPLVFAAVAAQAQRLDWPVHGRDLAGTRYIPATEISRENVERLAIAWTYRTGETQARFDTREDTSFEATPLVVNGVMYIGTPLGRVIALDAATGGELWVFDPEIDRNIAYGDFASRASRTG
jgi:quinoprotein glucose dehydrogenase